MGIEKRLVRGNFSNSDTAVGGRWTQIAEYHTPDGESITVTVRSAFVPFPRTGSPPAGIPRVLLRIIAGAGGSGGVGTAVITHAGTPKRMSGSDFYVEAQIFFDELGTVLAPASVTTDVIASFVDGHGQDLQPTLWAQGLFPQMAGPSPLLVGAFQTLFVGPGKLREVIGYNHSPSPTWLMFFDWPVPGQLPTTAPANGAVPILTIPLPGSPGAPGTDPFFYFDAIESKKEFVYGLAFATSSDGTTFVLDATGQVHVEAEFYQGDKPGRS